MTVLDIGGTVSYNISGMAMFCHIAEAGETLYSRWWLEQRIRSLYVFALHHVLLFLWQGPPWRWKLLNCSLDIPLSNPVETPLPLEPSSEYLKVKPAWTTSSSKVSGSWMVEVMSSNDMMILVFLNTRHQVSTNFLWNSWDSRWLKSELYHLLRVGYSQFLQNPALL